MPNNKIQRRTLSKVEQQLLKEQEEETRRIKQQKKNAWIKKQNEIKKYNKSNNNTPKCNYHNTVKTPNNIIKHTNISVINNYKWKCVNNSWADQTEFEDIRKNMLMRMAYKLMKK